MTDWRQKLSLLSDYKLRVLMLAAARESQTRQEHRLKRQREQISQARAAQTEIAHLEYMFSLEDRRTT